MKNNLDKQHPVCQVGQYIFASGDIGQRNVLIGFVGQFKVAGAVGKAIVVIQFSRDNGGIGIAWEKADLGRAAGYGCAAFSQHF